MPDAQEIALYQQLRGIIAKLRAPDGCPWDREQTHASLRPYVIEEAYEVVAVLDSGDYRRLPEELGDVLFQVLLHAQLAEESGDFDMSTVLTGLSEKLVRRHPHVFGNIKLETSSQVIDQWDELKKAERANDDSALANVPAAMPALAYAQTLLRRAEAAGFAWPKREDVLDKLREELEELAAASTPEDASDELGDILLNVTNYARYLGIDAEEALRNAGHKFRHRFTAVESEARSEGAELKSETREQLMARWQRAKQSDAN